MPEAIEARKVRERVILLAAPPTGPVSTTALALAVFGASTVEMVEALTLVVAAGTRSWRSAIEGASAALCLLALMTAAIGLPLARFLPIDTLRVVVGTLLLVLGLSWLRKAVLRGGGRMAKHDEDAIFERTVGNLAPGGLTSRRDGAAFLVAFKGVMLEGFEVVLIVVSLGTSSHDLPVAAASAAAAVVLVAIVGAVVARQLSRVPENTLKTVVGVMLSGFGTYWVGEGAGIRWPGSELALLVLLGLFALAAAALVSALRHTVAGAGSLSGSPGNGDGDAAR